MNYRFPRLQIKFLIVGLCLSFIGEPCNAQIKISDALASNFKSLTSSCFGNEVYNEKFFPQGLISHPMASETRFKKISNVSFGAISTLIYRKQDLDEALAAGGTRFLTNLNIPAQNISVNSDFASLIYNFSCISALKTALSAGFDPAPRWTGSSLNIQAGLNAELTNSANTGLVVLYGRFRSPFSMMLQDSNPETRMTAYSAIWKYYVDNDPTVPNLAYLDFLEGWLVTSTTAKDAANALDLNGTANVHALIVNADWSGSASIKYNSSFKSQAFDIYLVPRTGSAPLAYNYNMYALPRPNAISTEIQQDSILYPADITQVIPGQLSQFKVAIPGLASQFCNIAQWDVTAPPPTVVVNSTNSIDPNTKACVIDISLQLPPAAALFNNIQIILVNTAYPIGGNSISFKKNIRYQNSTYPIAHLSELPKLQFSGEKNIALSIDIPIAIEVAPGIATPNDVKVVQATLNCQPTDPAKQAPPVSPALNYVYIPQPQPTVHTVFTFPRNDFPDASCNWSAIINFTYNGAAINGKQINVPISLDHTLLPPIAAK